MPGLAILDLETDTSGDPTGRTIKPGLDPRHDPITTIAIATDSGLQVTFEAGKGKTDERSIINAGTALLDDLEDHVVVTWNGLEFDGPYYMIRAAIVGARDPMVRFNASPFVPQRISKYGAREWADQVPFSQERGAEMFPSWNAGTWAGHHHVDLAQEYRLWAIGAGVEWSLEPVACAVLGVEPWKVNRASMHELTAAERIAYGMKDVENTLGLALAAADILGIDWSRFVRAARTSMSS